MTKRESNKLNMYEAVSAVLSNYSDVIATMPAFAEAVEDYKGSISGIKETDAKHESIASGKTNNKENAEDELIEVMVSIAGVMYAYANRNKLEELKSICKVSESQLEKMRDVDLAAKGKLIHSKAAALTAELVNYSITETEVGLLNEKITQFENSIEDHHGSFAEKKAARAVLSEKYDETDRILKDEIDSFVEFFRTKNEDFYNAYFAARVIKNLGVRHKDAGTETEEPAQP